jgi:hypothetical protein
MSDGWSKVARGLGRGEPAADRGADPDADDDRSVPAGWEALAARRPAGRAPAPTERGEPRTAPPGWEALAPQRDGGAQATAVVDQPDDARELDVAETVAPTTTGGSRPPRRARRSREAEPVAAGEATDAALDRGDGTADTGHAGSESPDGGDGSAAPRRRPRARTLIGGGAIVVLAVVGVVVGLLLTSGGLPADAAFSVDGKVTTVAQLKAQVNVLDELQGITPPSQADKGAYDSFLRTSAQALAVQQLVGDIAKRQGITIPAKTTRADLDQLVSTKYNNDRSQFDAALSSAGLNETEVLDALNAQAVENALYSRHTNSNVRVTSAQVAQTYSANQPLTQPEQRAMSIIVVATQATAQDVINQLNGGANFATLASQDSLDASKSSGGADGTYSEADLQNSGQTALAQAVFGATPNVPFGPVQANGGEWVVGEVTSVTPSQTFTDDAQTQAAIKNYLTDQQLRQQWIGYLAKQLRTADITYAPAYRPAHPHQAPQPALPSVLQFVVNAHNQSAPSGTPGTTPTAP